MAGKIVTYDRAAELLGVPLGTLYDWVSRRKVPHIRLGKRLVRFDEEELVAWRDRHRVEEETSFEGTHAGGAR